MNPQKADFSQFKLEIEIILAVLLTTLLLVMATIADLYTSAQDTPRLETMQRRLTEDGRLVEWMLQRLVAQAGDQSRQEDAPAFLEAISDTSTKILFTGNGSPNIDCNGDRITGPKAITIFSADNSLLCNDGTTTHRFAATPSDGKGTELASFRIGYGIDTEATFQGRSATIAPEYLCTGSKDCIADSFIYGKTSETVVAVHFCFVLRTEETDNSVEKTTAIKGCDNKDIADSQTDHRLYRQFNTTVLLKKPLGRS